MAVTFPIITCETRMLPSLPAANLSDEIVIDAAELHRLNALNVAIGQAIATDLSLSDMLETCVEAIANCLHSALVRLWTFDDQSQMLELQAVAGQHIHTNELPNQIPLGISIVGLIANNRTPYLTNQVLDEVWLQSKDWISQEQIVAFAGYPLVIGSRLVGVLALFNRQPLSALVHQGLQYMAQVVANVIERLNAQRELMNRREAVLFRLASQVRSSLDLDTILNTAVQEIRRILQIDRCNFLWCWPDPNGAPTPVGHPTPLLAITHEARQSDLASLLGDCAPEHAIALADSLLELEILKIDNIQQELSISEALRSQLLDRGLTSFLLLPLATRSGQIGAIICGHTAHARPWSESDIELLQAVADQLAIAIDQAELYAQTRASAFAAQAQANQISETLKTLQQAQAKLVQSEKMSSLGQLVAGIAHEINNPVNFISGNVEYAQDYFHDLIELIELYQTHYPDPVEDITHFADEIDLEFLLQDLDKMLSSMKVGTERIQKIVLSLRNFSRLDEAELKPVDIHEGLENTLMILHNRLKSKGEQSGIEVMTSFGELPKIECYAGPLNQVFMNLLSNAIDALEEQPEPRQIWITTETDTVISSTGDAASETMDVVRIRIRDNGQGIPPEHKDHLFDPFFTTKPVGKGTGLGLSISYQIIVERHSGTLTCVSEPGQGAEFIIEIPIQNFEDLETNTEFD